ncbi:MAG: response regulator [Deltaproteobacteria bacterium]|nr:MAG: response regulator [Deltaproteobacteria bacterium]
MLGYENLRIGHKLALGFTLMILLSAGTCYLGIRGMAALERQAMTLYESTLRHAVYTNEAYTELLHHNRRLYRHIAGDEAEVMALVEKQCLENEAALLDTLGKYRATELAPAEAELLARFDRAWPNYLETKNTAFRLSAAMNKKAALELAEAEGRPAFKELDDILATLQHYNFQEGEDNRTLAQVLFLDERYKLVAILLLSMTVGTALAWLITRLIVLPLRQAVEINRRLILQGSEQLGLIETIADGDYSQTIPPPAELEIAEATLHGDEAGDLLRSALQMSKAQRALSRSMVKMTGVLRTERDAAVRREWIAAGINLADEQLRGEKSAGQLCEGLLPFLAPYLGATVGALYLLDRQQACLTLASGWALPADFRQACRLAVGEGLLGQAASERRRLCVNDMPGDYLPVTSAFGRAATCQVIAQPLVHDGQLFGAMELGCLHPLPPEAFELLDQIAANLALALKVAHSREQINDLLEQAQQQAEELRVQQEELQQSNEELEERAQLLEQQREQISAQNREIELATEQLRLKAAELERISAYKSEFLANMSHELRSPLNSLLILSSLLQGNREGNLTEKQVKFAATIHTAGKDLLALINDILDLSKVEAGRLEMHYEPTSVRELCTALQTLCQPQFDAKGLQLRVAIADTAPDDIDTDPQRLQQILRNLLSNACKFTDEGEVTLSVEPLKPGEHGLREAGLAFEVRDTGIGVAPEKQQLIFEAFRQADGSTSRKYGGTGLGLSIALQLARRMGGGIELSSNPGRGSIFTLVLPLHPPDTGAVPEPPRLTAPAAAPGTTPAAVVPALEDLPQPVPDDRAALGPDDRAILIIEDDLHFARLLAEMVRARRFKVLVAADGENGIALAERFQPSAVILDVMLPHIDGWAVMRHLKDNPRTRHIPVHFITCLDEERKALGMGAIGYLRKPVTAAQLDSVFGTIEQAVAQTTRRLLIVEDNEQEAMAMVELLGERNVDITVVPSGQAAIEQLQGRPFDCIVLDLGLADTTGFTLLEHLRSHPELHRIPVIIHSGQDISREDEIRLRRYAERIIIKGTRSPDRLLNEVTLFLHLVESGLSTGKQKMIRLALDQEAMLAGKKVLVVDDDMRNIFSLSHILAEKQMVVFEAENGREALAQLDAHPDADLVLMDIMMPEMDGYEAMRAIRRDDRFARLPVIAMTAKALKGDREKCLEAGASDYISKPIDTVKLLSLLRVWLYQGDGRQ